MKPTETSAGRPAIAGWLLFDWAAQPWFTLVTTFVFAPYFAAHLAPDPVTGQSIWGFANGAAGFAIAVVAPVLGAIADQSGARKPWIAVFTLLAVAGGLLLWFAAPGLEAAIAIAIAGFVIGTIGVEFATVFTNAMMPTLVPRAALGRLSGNGWAVGYFGGLVSLVVVLGLLVGDPETGKTLLGVTPLFGLGTDAHQGDRISGPFSAVWMIVFIIPLFLFTPDQPVAMPLTRAVRTGLRTLAATFSEARRNQNAFRFLIGRMIYADGLVALFAFGGVYAAGIFGWTSIQLGLFGILLTITGGIGAWIGGILDDRLGPKAVISGSLVILILSAVAILSTGPSTIFFVVDTEPAVSGAPFQSVPERVFMAIGVVLGMAAGPVQAASRTMLIAVAPPDKETQFFGLFALSGKLTSFIGPFAVGALTAAAGSQQIGLAAIPVFFLVGLVLLAGVRESRD